MIRRYTAVPVIASFLALLVACQSPNSAVTTMNPERIAGVYRGGDFELDLRPDSSATFTQEAIPHIGRWSGLPPQLRFDFPLGTAPRPESITWTIQGDDLVPLIWDKGVYGRTGPALHRSR